MCTNREFGHPTHCILHTQYILHTVFKTCCWLLTADLTDSEGLAHFQIWICLGTKPVSCLLVFFILFSLRIFAFPKKCTWLRRLASQFMCTRRCQAGATFKTLAACEIPVFIRVFNILHSIVPSIPCLTTKWKNKTKTSITSWQKEKRNNNENEAPQRVNARRHQKPCRSPGSNRIPTPIRVNRFINSAKSSSSCFFFVQFRIRVHCSQIMINHAFVSKAAMSSVCTLHPCRLWRRLAKKENKHRWSPQHVQLLWRDWARQSSQVQDQSICMVHIFAGGTNTRVRTPRKWAPWCSFSRMVHKFASEFVRRCTFTRGGTNTLLHRCTGACIRPKMCGIESRGECMSVCRKKVARKLVLVKSVSKMSAHASFCQGHGWLKEEILLHSSPGATKTQNRIIFDSCTIRNYVLTVLSESVKYVSHFFLEHWRRPGSCSFFLTFLNFPNSLYLNIHLIFTPLSCFSSIVN